MEGLEPVLRGEPVPNAFGRAEQVLLAREGATRQHLFRPLSGATAIEKGFAGFRIAKLIEEGDPFRTRLRPGLAEKAEAADSTVGINIEAHVRRGAYF